MKTLVKRRLFHLRLSPSAVAFTTAEPLGHPSIRARRPKVRPTPVTCGTRSSLGLYEGPPKDPRRNEGSRGWKGLVGSHPLMSVAPLNLLRTPGARSTPSRSAPPQPLSRLLLRGRRSCSLGGDRVLYAPGRVSLAGLPPPMTSSLASLNSKKASRTSSPECGGAF